MDSRRVVPHAPAGLTAIDPRGDADPRSSPRERCSTAIDRLVLIRRLPFQSDPVRAARRQSRLEPSADAPRARPGCAGEASGSRVGRTIPALGIGETVYDRGFARGAIAGPALSLARALLPEL